MIDLLNITVRNLRRRGLRSWLTMLGIFIGIAAVVALISLGEGLRTGITDTFSDIGPDRLTVQAEGTPFGPPGSTAVRRLTEEDIDAVRKVRGVDVVASRLLRTSGVEYNDQQRFGFIVSLPDMKEERDLIFDSITLDTEKGRMIQSGERSKVTFGNNYLTQDYFGKELKVGSKVLINGETFEVVGFLEKMSNPQFNDLILMNEEVMIDLLDIGIEVDIIVLKIKDIEQIDRIVEDINKALRKSRDVEEGKEDFTVETPDQVIEAFNTIFNAVQSVIIGVAAISLIVGGVGIANTMFTSVLERRREIGVLKAIGARNGTILTMFLLESGMLGLTGGLIGIFLGFVLAKIVEILGGQFFGEGVLIAQFSPGLLIGSLLFSFFVGAISGLIPARQASLLQPVEALRK